MVVNVAGTVAEEIANTATVTSGGDADPSNHSATDTIPARDACPNGWSPEQTVSFAPPFRPGMPGGIHTGVVNPERPDGCTLLDRIWDREPFMGHGDFVHRGRRHHKRVHRRAAPDGAREGRDPVGGGALTGWLKGRSPAR